MKASVCGVRWASCPPIQASRLNHQRIEQCDSCESDAAFAFGWSRQYARTGGRDAHPTPHTSL